MKRVAEICQARIATGKYDAKKDEKGNTLETYCNFFVRDVALERGYPGFKDLTANAIIAMMDGSPDWEEIDAEKAQAFASEDKLVVVGCYATGGHGHIAVVVPGPMTFSGQRKAMVPIIANAGKDTFYGKPLSFGFGTRTVSYFILKADKGQKGGY